MTMPDRSPARPGADEAVEAAFVEKREQPDEILALNQAVDAAYRARAEFFASDGLTYDEFMNPDGFWTSDRDIIADAVGHAYPIIAAAVLAEAEKRIEAKRPHIPVLTDPRRREHLVQRSTFNSAVRVVAELRSELTT